MRKIGITGGIGSGKTTVCEVFKQFGIPIYNTDLMAKRLMNKDSDLINSIKLEFGNGIYNNGQLEKAKLASMVFNSPEKLKKLNALVHPAVAADFENWVRNQHSDLVIKEAAILFETGGYEELDAIILIHAPKEVRLLRVMKRDGVSKNEVLSRMNNQWPDEKKIKLTDHIVQNHGDHLVVPQILELLEVLRK